MGEFVTNRAELLQIIEARGEWRVVGHDGQNYRVELWIDGKRCAQFAGIYLWKTNEFRMRIIDSDVPGSWGSIGLVDAMKVRNRS